MELVLIHTERKVAFASVPHKSSPLIESQFNYSIQRLLPHFGTPSGEPQQCSGFNVHKEDPEQGC